MKVKFRLGCSREIDVRVRESGYHIEPEGCTGKRLDRGKYQKGSLAQETVKLSLTVGNSSLEVNLWNVRNLTHTLHHLLYVT